MENDFEEDREDREDREELDELVFAFRVHEELDEHLAQVWTNHGISAARERLRLYLSSPRLIRGLESTQRLSQGKGNDELV